jgi:hypothetical protein
VKFQDNANLHPHTTRNAPELAKKAKLARRRKPIRRNPDSVIEEESWTVDPRVLAKALELADGDKGRLELKKDGSIYIHNSREQRRSS